MREDGRRQQLLLMTLFAVRLVVHGEDHGSADLRLAIVTGAALLALLHDVHGELPGLPLLHLEDLRVARRALLGALVLVQAVAEGDFARAVLALVEAEVGRDFRLGDDGPRRSEERRVGKEGRSPWPPY